MKGVGFGVVVGMNILLHQGGNGVFIVGCRTSAVVVGFVVIFFVTGFVFVALAFVVVMHKTG